MKWKILFATGAIFLTCISHADLVVNGTFDVSVPSNGTGGGWTSNNIGGTGGWHEFDGERFFNLNEGGNVAIDPYIEQTLMGLVPGQTYRVTGDFMNYYIGWDVPDSTFGVDIDGTYIFESDAPNPSYICPWPDLCAVQFTPFSAEFVATANSHVLRISGERNGHDIDYAVDNITVEEQDCSPVPDDLVAWWPGDANAQDIQGGNSGTLHGDATFDVGRVEDAFSVNGSTDYIEIPHSPDFNIQDAITVDAWIMKLGNCTHNCPIVAKQSGTGPCCNDLRYALTVYGWGDNNVTFSFNTGSWQDRVVSQTPILNDQWYHLAGTYDGNVAKIYVNGVLDNIAQQGGPIKPSEAGPLFIGLGRHTYDEFFNGLIDEVEIFDRALSADEIWEIFKAGSAGKCKADEDSCAGFEPPMNNGPVKVKGNRALPFKAQLFDSDGDPMTDLDLTAPPVIQVWYENGMDPAADVSEDALPSGQSTEGNQFFFDGERWHYNLKTKNYSAAGTYTVFMDSGDESEYIVDPTCEASFVVE